MKFNEKLNYLMGAIFEREASAKRKAINSMGSVRENDSCSSVLDIFFKNPNKYKGRYYKSFAEKMEERESNRRTTGKL